MTSIYRRISGQPRGEKKPFNLPGERFAHDYTARVTFDDGEQGGLRLEVLECKQKGMGQGRRAPEIFFKWGALTKIIQESYRSRFMSIVNWHFNFQKRPDDEFERWLWLNSSGIRSSVSSSQV